MKIELIKGKKGQIRYSFVYYDNKTKKTVRISKEEIKQRFGKDVTDFEDALEKEKILQAELDSAKNRLQKTLSWENEYYNFSQLLKLYETSQKKKAPNSWQNNIHYLKYYVLPFFLTLKKCNNLSQWPDYYYEFKEWLEDVAVLVKSPEKQISYASKNHAIKALNTFMRHLHGTGVIKQLILCVSFPSKNLAEKGMDEIISVEDMEKVYENLKEGGNELEAIFYRLLYFTGMRFNEGFGLHAGNIYEGEIEDKIMAQHLKIAQISHYGYLVFDSQPEKSSSRLRNENGELKRKPLKGRHKIDHKSARTVVITDKILWNHLVTLHNKALELHHTGCFGTNLENYPLFEEMNKTSSSKRLKLAYEKSNLRYRTWHACRHTRATMLIGETGNSFLAMLWLGHSSERVLKRYVHIYEAVIRNIKKKGAGFGERISKLKQVK